MASRPEVRVASAPITVVDVVGLGGTFLGAVARTTLRAPWRGPASPLHNIAVASTRELIRSLMGYLTSLPLDEFRALESVLDGVSRTVLPPFVKRQGVRMAAGRADDVPGLWFRTADSDPVGTIVYLHGGGNIGTSPSMYALFMAHLVRVTHCDVFAPDYRLAPEFPYPAGTQDIIAVLSTLAQAGVPNGRIFLAGDSGGGGMVGSVLRSCADSGVPLPDGAVLFSPEVSLDLNQPSVRENATRDVLPWNAPTNAYLYGLDADDPAVSLLQQDLSQWPPTFVAYGGDEIFRDAIRAFHQQLDDAGVRCEVHEVADMFHVFPFLLPWAEESRHVYDQVGAFIASVVDAHDER